MASCLEARLAFSFHNFGMTVFWLRHCRAFQANYQLFCSFPLIIHQQMQSNDFLITIIPLYNYARTKQEVEWSIDCIAKLGLADFRLWHANICNLKAGCSPEPGVGKSSKPRGYNNESTIAPAPAQGGARSLWTSVGSKITPTHMFCGADKIPPYSTSTAFGERERTVLVLYSWGRKREDGIQCLL